MTGNCICFEQAELRDLRPVSLELGSGLHVIHCPDGIGVPEFFQLSTGLSRPRRGKVSLRSRVPFADPELRTHIASRLPEERLPAARTLSQSLHRLDLAPVRVEAVLTMALSLDPSIEAATLVPRMPPSQHATVALAIALTTPHAWALLLSEPLKHLRAPAQAEVQATLLRLSVELPVVVVTASVAQATKLGTVSHELVAGIHRPLAAQRAGWSGLRVQGIGLRSLVAEMSRQTTLRNLQWTAEFQGQEAIELETSDLAGNSLMIARASRETGARVFSIRSSTVPK